ncbi:MAG: response regulator transcription factor [Bacteroidetes bacterium]|jgi:DNA-binding response OmpR family regulator|nr:response regulator transcription factor [Bacteroidota bacterium]MDF1866000.1 response regulator transcription factor [Saprospiraceae bacterium]
MTPKILLVEDDQTLGFLLKEYLQMRDFEVTWAQNGADGLRRFNQEAFNLCVLDIMMPAIDGFTLAELIRNRNTEVPIIFLTAKSLTEDVIKGFKIGADDYIKKPVSEEELVARIQAVFRRSKISEVEESEALFEIGKYHFDSKNQQLTVDGNTRQLTEREAELLKMLCQNKGTLVSRKYVLQKLWGKTDYFTRKSMDVFISRLRKYLAADDSIKIMNVHGSGFVLSDN